MRENRKLHVLKLHAHRFEQRIEAAAKVARAGYPMGFIIAPIIWHEGWEEGYGELIASLRYPRTKLEMDIEKRKYKWGRWGQGKYVYPDEQANALRMYISERIFDHFPEAKIEYFT